MLSPHSCKRSLKRALTAEPLDISRTYCPRPVVYLLLARRLLRWWLSPDISDIRFYRSCVGSGGSSQNCSSQILSLTRDLFHGFSGKVLDHPRIYIPLVLPALSRVFGPLYTMCAEIPLGLEDFETFSAWKTALHEGRLQCGQCNWTFSSIGNDRTHSWQMMSIVCPRWTLTARSLMPLVSGKVETSLHLVRLIPLYSLYQML